MMTIPQVLILLGVIGIIADVALSLAIWNRNDFEERISLLEKKLKEKDNEQTHE